MFSLHWEILMEVLEQSKEDLHHQGSEALVSTKAHLSWDRCHWKSTVEYLNNQGASAWILALEDQGAALGKARSTMIMKTRSMYVHLMIQWLLNKKLCLQQTWEMQIWNWGWTSSTLAVGWLSWTGHSRQVEAGSSPSRVQGASSSQTEEELRQRFDMNPQVIRLPSTPLALLTLELLILAYNSQLGKNRSISDLMH